MRYIRVASGLYLLSSHSVSMIQAFSVILISSIDLRGRDTTPVGSLEGAIGVLL